MRKFCFRVSMLLPALYAGLALPAFAQDANPSSKRFFESGLTKQQDGTFTFQIQAEKIYRVMLIAENETGMTIYEKVIGV